MAELISIAFTILKSENFWIAIGLILFGIVFLFTNKKMIGLETKSILDSFRVDFARLEQRTNDNVHNRTCKHHEIVARDVSDCVGKVQAITDESRQKDKEIEQKLNDIKDSISSLHVATAGISKDLSQHTLVLSMYENHQMFLKEIRDTFGKSLDILKSDNTECQRASAYLLYVAEQVVDIAKYIHHQGILNLESSTLDGKLATSINECKKQMLLFYDKTVVERYFESSIPVWNFKKKLTDLIKSRERTNNIERSFRTMVIAFCEKLCNNFFLEIYMNKGEK